MADIVVCGDLEHEIERTGELKRLKALGSVEIFNELDPARETLVSRLHGTRAILEVRGRAALDRETLRQLPDLEIIASTGPHRIDFEAASELGIVVATTPRFRPPPWPILSARWFWPLRVTSAARMALYADEPGSRLQIVPCSERCRIG